LSTVRAFALFALALPACAGPQRTPQHPPPSDPTPDQAPELTIESPSKGALVRAQEVEVRGRVKTYDGRAWVYVESTTAEIKDGLFIARHVPLRPGAIEIAVELSDGRGRKQRVTRPLIVESPARPRSSQLCRPAGCLRYEERGVPRRGADGRIMNAIVVLPPFGFDERLDEVFPDLIGPGRALDPMQRYILGVAPAATDMKWPGSDALVTLVGELFADRELDPGTALVGVSAFGGELALRALSKDAPWWHGPLLVLGGHDRPAEEQAMQAIRAALTPNDPPRPLAPAQAWAKIAAEVVPLGYGPRYLADPSHAAAIGLDPKDPAIAATGLGKPLIDAFAKQLPARVPLSELQQHVDAAFALSRSPLVYPPLDHRRVVLVANREDRLVTASRVRATGVRLTAAGAKVSYYEVADPLGHHVFFLAAPLEVEAAFSTLLGAGPSASR
jgi:hypothetical protein